VRPAQVYGGFAFDFIELSPGQFDTYRPRRVFSVVQHSGRVLDVKYIFLRKAVRGKNELDFFHGVRAANSARLFAKLGEGPSRRPLFVTVTIIIADGAGKSKGE
jgi:hypothetical protein